jgi:hypothetical protein
MNKQLIIALPFFLLLLTACPEAEGENSANSNDLPASAEGFIFTWYNGGGMINMSYNAYVCGDSAYWLYDRNGYETILRWNPSKDDIDKFYGDLRDQEFNKITSNCDNEVYDRGGDSYGIEVDGKEYEINNSGNCFIDEKWRSNYTKLNEIMNAYLNQEIEKQMLPIDVVAGENLINSEYLVKIDLENGFGGFNANKDTSRMNYNLYPGYNQISVQMFFKDSTNYYGTPATFAYESLFLEVNAATKSVWIDRVDNKFTIEAKD